MKKNKLVVILSGFGFGGAEHMVYEKIKNVDREKYDVHAICIHSRKDIELTRRVEEICPVTYLNQDRRMGIKQVITTIRAIKKQKPDVVHAHMGGVGYAAIWSVIYRRPVVITIHTKPEQEFSKKVETLIRMSLRFGKTKLVAVSQENFWKVKEHYGVDDTKAAFVNNGIDIGRFFRREHKTFTLINVARHDENKNQTALIHCFNRLHSKCENTKLLLLGDGVTHDKLIELVNELGLADAVDFTGNVSNTEDYYAVSDVYVQTSHVEAMPISVLEAMAAGLPIVSTDVGGLRDAVRDNGYLVPDNDEEALYQAIWRIFNQDTEQTDVMCEASKRIVQEYSSKNTARQYEKIYQEML